MKKHKKDNTYFYTTKWKNEDKIWSIVDASGEFLKDAQDDVVRCFTYTWAEFIVKYQKTFYNRHDLQIKLVSLNEVNNEKL